MTAHKQPAAYIMASEKDGRLYVGVTSDLPKRIWQHREGYYEGWSKIHQTTRLVYYEFHDMMDHAIAREKQIKKWPRGYKINLIQAKNPEWHDRYSEIS